MDQEALIHQYLLGGLGAEDVKRLDQALAEDVDLREEFLFAVDVDAGLRELSLRRSVEDAQERFSPRGAALRPDYSIGRWVALAAVAASALFAAGFWAWRSPAIATIASSENAAWESSLPTSPGSDLPAGSLSLRAGIATLRFRSGAELVVEAPAQLELVSAMHARLNQGAAVMQVPDSAKGFVLEAPDGYAIDFGTRFAVRVDRREQTADFELIEGEIEVHHPASGASLRLNSAGSRAVVSARSMELLPDDATVDEAAADDSQPLADPLGRLVRIESDKCGSAMTRSQRRKRAIRPEILYVKKSDSGRFDLRSFFEFDLSSVDLEAAVSARLRLNLVPSYRGFASRLPTINRFAVYGLTNPAKADWVVETSWEDSPGPGDGVLLGGFEVARSEQRGTFGISGGALLEFIKQRQGEHVTLILVRETTQIEGKGPGLTHMFASDKHPESVGPLLELEVR